MLRGDRRSVSYVAMCKRRTEVVTALHRGRWRRESRCSSSTSSVVCSRLTASAAGAPDRLGQCRALGVPLPIPASTQFDITGFLQEARTAGPDAPGTLTINGQLVTVPASTIVILPASALTWDELFTQAPAPYGPTQTGLAMFDTPT